MEFKHTIEVVMTLTVEEALWLHAVMQNPLHGQTPQDELTADRDMRRKFYNATSLPR